MVSAGRQSILVIDDEKSILDSLAVFLRRNGYAVFTADTGKEGLQIAKREMPDLIILDLILPDIDGSDVAAELLNDPHIKKIPIIFVTSIVTKTDQQQPGEMVANRCIVAKPCPPDEILKLIRKHIGSTL